MYTKITKESLLADKWYETGDGVVPMKKDFLSAKDDEDHPDKVSLILHKYYNEEMFAIAMPDGSLLNLNPESIEDLQKIQSLIVSYNPIY